MTDKTDIILKSPDLPVIEIVDNLVQVYKEYMVVRAALKLNLFDWLDENGPATPEEISNGTGIRPEYMTSLLGTLYYLDIIRRSGEKFLISPSASMHFVSSKSLYQGSFIINSSSPESPWASLDSILTEEKSPSTDPISPDYIRSDAQQAIRGMVQNVTNIISRWSGFSVSAALLEINGGHGLYAIAACQINETLKASVCSCSPGGTEALDDYVRRYSMEGRVTQYTRNIWSEKPDREFDIIIASHSLYKFQDDLSKVVIQIRSLLKEGGLFVSNHWFKGTMEGTGMQGLYELDLALNNRSHLMKDRDAFEEICKKNGLKIFQSGIIRSGYGESRIHMAEKKYDKE